MMPDGWETVAPAPAKAGSSGGWETIGSAPAAKAAAAAPASPPTLLSRAMAPVRAIPGNIAEAFDLGAKAVVAAGKEQDQAIKAKSTLLPSSLKLLGGYGQELFSPITGTVEALVQKPIREQFPKDSLTGKLVSNFAGDAASMFGPMAVEKSAASIAKLAPKISDSVKILRDAGVRLTPGQIFRGVARNVEETTRSAPLIGSFINKAQLRSVEDFNRAGLNKSLAKVGEKLPAKMELGRKAIAYVGRKLGEKYDAILPKLTFRADPQFDADAKAILSSSQNGLLNPSQQNQLAAVIRHFEDNLDPATMSMTGEQYKHLESEISFLARTHLDSGEPTNQLFGRVLVDLSGALKSALARANPRYADQLANLNSAWATFARLQGASIRDVKTGGLFSPTNLLQELRSSSPKGIFAAGDAELQSFADAGANVLPESLAGLERERMGLYERGLWLALLGAGGEGELSKYITPEMAAGAAGLSALYTRPGVAAVNAAVDLPPKIGAVLRSPVTAASAAAANEARNEKR